MSTQVNIPMVKVVYSTTNSTRHPLHGSVKVLGDRSVNYGWRKNGDVFNVAEADILARPDLFLAYPCKEPFIIKNNKVIVPCGEEKVESKFKSLEDIPGVGPSTAEKLVELGIYTPQDIIDNADDGIFEQLPTTSAKKIKEWQNAQNG